MRLPDVNPTDPQPGASPRAAGPITPAYEHEGVEAFYQRTGDTYRNPHESSVIEALRAAHALWQFDVSTVLDLACGSGEATLILQALGAVDVRGVDPFTAAAYRERTGLDALTFDFAAVERGALSDQHFSTVVCSYAMHLHPVSRLPALCRALAHVTSTLVIVSPHKRPVLRPEWGWSFDDELIVDRVHARLHHRSW